MEEQLVTNQQTQPQIQLETTNNSPIVNATDKKSEVDLVPVEPVQVKTENKNEPVPRRVSLELDRNLDLDIFGFIIPEGSSPSVHIDPNTVRRREKKMERNDDNWDKWKKRSKLRSRIKKGVPESYRGLCWKLLLEIPEKIKNNQGLYQKLIDSPADAQVINDITVDLPRTFPDHFLFKFANGAGQKELYNVLKAYACKNPELGYCQGMSGVAAVLLMYCTPEEAFFMLDTILDSHMNGYYSAGLLQLKQDSAIFDYLLQEQNIPVYSHLKSKNLNIDVILFTTRWFMTLYTQSLCWETVVRVWDVFFLKGIRFIFKAGLAILKLYTPEIIKIRQLEGLLPFLLEPPLEKTRADILLPVALKIKFTARQLHQLRKKIIVN